jgi:RHS repeat-associated protein
MLYSGEQFDPNLQMQYLRARYYNQNAGVFNRVDPFNGNMGDPQSLHKYSYCHQNPVMGIDPSGEFFIVDFLIAVTMEISTRTIHAVKVIAAKYWALSKIQKAVTLFNAIYNGTMNVYFGPPKMSNLKKFFVGAIAGFIEAWIAFKNPTVATLANSVIMDVGNTTFSDKEFSISELGDIAKNAIISVAIAKGLGKATQDTTLSAIDNFVLSFDATLATQGIPGWTEWFRETLKY